MASEEADLTDLWRIGEINPCIEQTPVRFDSRVTPVEDALGILRAE
ncbi:hypothetical protein [Sandaracinobacteroides hominis]|nr:hypothetical protein [Sandaracinobacteroides hominis]